MKVSIDFGQVYLKCGVYQSKSLVKTIIQHYDISKFTYIDYKLMNSDLALIDKMELILFKVTFKTKKDFLSSIDYKFLSELLDFNAELSILYSGYPLKHDIELFSLLFPNSKLIHISKRSTYLSIEGIDLIHVVNKTKLFKVVDKHIVKLQSVGKVDKLTESDKIYIDLNEDFYPYILANIVEGSSIYKVTSQNKFERLGGSSFGSTTYWSLVQMCCGYDDPITAVLEGLDGDNSKVDLSVGDIFGGGFDQYNLPADLIASSFGKIKKADMSKIDRKDISKSLLILFSLCNGQIISLLAQQENIKKIIITGNPFPALEMLQIFQMIVSFMTNNKISMYFSDYSAYLALIGHNSLDN